MIVKTEKEEYVLSKYLSLIIPSHYEKEIEHIFTPPESTIKKNIEEINKPISVDQIKNYILNIETLTLGVTQDCNLRCKYCVYGGKYKYRRTHNPKTMKYETYTKAIDFFFETVNSPLRINRTSITIGFYGGEPLLEFENLYSSVKYAREKHSKSSRQLPLNFILTTNGLSLSLEKTEALYKEDFIIDVSLDGPKEEHDKYRIQKSGNGSFDTILGNIEEIKEKFPERYPKQLRFYITLHPFHDLKKLEDFFLSNSHLFNELNVSIAWVGLKDLNEEFKKSWPHGKREQVKQIATELDRNKWFYKKLVCTWVEHLYDMQTQRIADMIDFTNSCSPGIDRVFVDVDGNLHTCERINNHFPIGNVETGFDFESIKNIISSWNKEIISMECWNCEAWWLCGWCLANCATEGGFKIDKKECDKFIQATRKSIVDVLNIWEKEDESKTADCYSDINNYLDAL